VPFDYYNDSGEPAAYPHNFDSKIDSVLNNQQTEKEFNTKPFKKQHKIIADMSETVKHL
ncbi:9317_t:CDS:1, partial [Paraglomus brasilianum]